jgi:ADP-ribose pyrophosphatase
MPRTRAPLISAIVPVDAGKNVYLVRQFRAPLEKVTFEIPAGKLDKSGEDRLQAAKRELREETGFQAENWTKLTDLATTPGFCTEVISIYLATGLSAGETDFDEDEFLNLVKMPLSEADDMVMRGEICDSKTVCGILMATRVLEHA